MSIKKIAEKVGTSTATVSRVLNDPTYHCARDGMREAIWKAAMELNYVPNEAARNLKMGTRSADERIYYVNVLMTRTDHGDADPFYTELLNVVESETHRNNCILSKVYYNSIFSDDKKCRTSDLAGIVRQMREEDEGKGDAMIVIGRCNMAALGIIKEAYRSVVSINRNSTNHTVDEVTCDGSKISSMAVEHLISLGHKNIGYVGARINESRYEGFLETMQAHSLTVYEDYIYESRPAEAAGYDIMQEMLQSGSYPTALYCANDIIAVGMLKCLAKYRRGFYRPSIVASDDIERAQVTRPMLTTVRLPKEEMGRLALYLACDRLRGGHQSMVRVELEGKLIVRNSCTRVEENGWSDYVI